MKINLIVLVLAFMLIAFPASAEETDKYDSALEIIKDEIQLKIEMTHMVTFQGPTKITFSFPPGMKQSESRGQHAWYEPNNRTLYVHPSYKYMVFTDDFTEDMTPIIRHELGQALTHQISLELKQDIFHREIDYAPEQFSKEWESLFLRMTITEGIGRVIERVGNSPSKKYCDFENYEPGVNFYVPYKKEDLSWDDPNMMVTMAYEGGYCTANPIVQKYGIKGIEYMLLNPIKMSEWNLRSALREYLDTAMKALATES